VFRQLAGSAILMFIALGTKQATVPQTRYPPLIHAELPFYPPVARSAHISGTVEIHVAVEKGVVVDTQVKSVEIQINDPLNHSAYNSDAKTKVGPYLSNPSLANVKTWQFGSQNRAEFLVNYVYQIKGEATDSPENPKVEFDLPLIKITAKPFKPTCSDCATRPD
jgi:hypothetical protein